jgi:hypothetical protein
MLGQILVKASDDLVRELTARWIELGALSRSMEAIELTRSTAREQGLDYDDLLSRIAAEGRRTAMVNPQFRDQEPPNPRRMRKV